MPLLVSTAATHVHPPNLGFFSALSRSHADDLPNMTAALAIHSGPLTAHLPPQAAAVFGMGLDQDPLPLPALPPLRRASIGIEPEASPFNSGAWGKEAQFVIVPVQTAPPSIPSDLDLSGFTSVELEYEDWMCDTSSVPSLTASIQSSPDEQNDPFLATGLIFGDEPTLGGCGDFFLGEPALGAEMEDVGCNPDLLRMIDGGMGVGGVSLGIDEPFVLVGEEDVRGVGGLTMDEDDEIVNSHEAKEVLPSKSNTVQYSAAPIISPPSPSRFVTIARAAEQGSSSQTRRVTPEVEPMVSCPVRYDDDMDQTDSVQKEEACDTDFEKDEHDCQSDMEEEEEKDTQASAAPLSPRLTVRPTIYEHFTEKGVDWCRYCGITQRSQTAAFRPGPWGKRTMCNKHGCDFKGYGYAEKQPRLDLAPFLSEEAPDRIRPILQEFCTACLKTGSVGTRVVQCDGCCRAYHPKCYHGTIPDEIVSVISSEMKWYCESSCASTRKTAKIAIDLPKRNLPFMKPLGRGPGSRGGSVQVTLPSFASTCSRSSGKANSLSPVSPKAPAAPLSYYSVRSQQRRASVAEGRRLSVSIGIDRSGCRRDDIPVPPWTADASQLPSPTSPSPKSPAQSATPQFEPTASYHICGTKRSRDKGGLDGDEGDLQDYEDLSDNAFNKRHAEPEARERLQRTGGATTRDHLTKRRKSNKP